MERIAELRKERGWSQVKLGAKADVNPSTVNQIERGLRHPNSTTLEKLADALGVEVADLFGRTARPKDPAPSAKASPGQPSDSEGSASPYLRAWRAYACRLRDIWQENPPTSVAEIRTVVSEMQALIDEGAFGQGENSAEAVELAVLEHAVRGLAHIADSVQMQNELRQSEEANPSLEEGAASSSEGHV